MNNLSAYGEHYDPATHSWPNGVRPTGPTCPYCKGRGEIEMGRDKQPWHTAVPNPNWEPWEPDIVTCNPCRGTGVRPPESFVSGA